MVTDAPLVGIEIEYSHMLQFLNQQNNFKIAYPYEYKITLFQMC